MWLLDNLILHSRTSVVSSEGYLVPQTGKTSSLNSFEAPMQSVPERNKDKHTYSSTTQQTHMHLSRDYLE
jgi:hypothetical protein